MVSHTVDRAKEIKCRRDENGRLIRRLQESRLRSRMVLGLSGTEAIGLHKNTQMPGQQSRGPKFLTHPRCVGGERFLQLLKCLDGMSKRFRRGDAFFVRRDFLKSQARNTSQLARKALSDDAKRLSDISHLRIFEISCSVDTHRDEARGEATANAPDIRAWDYRQNGIGVRNPGEIEHALPFGSFFGEAIGEFRERLGRSDSDRHRNASPLANSRSDFPGEVFPMRGIQRQERLIDRVDLHGRHQRTHRRHHSRRHIAVERIV